MAEPVEQAKLDAKTALAMIPMGLVIVPAAAALYSWLGKTVWDWYMPKLLSWPEAPFLAVFGLLLLKFLFNSPKAAHTHISVQAGQLFIVTPIIMLTAFVFKP